MPRAEMTWASCHKILYRERQLPKLRRKNPDGAKEEPKRKIDAKVFIQGFLPEEGGHIEKQRCKPGFSFEDSRKQEIQLFIPFLQRLYPKKKKKKTLSLKKKK